MHTSTKHHVRLKEKSTNCLIISVTPLDLSEDKRRYNTRAEDVLSVQRRAWGYWHGPEAGLLGVGTLAEPLSGPLPRPTSKLTIKVLQQERNPSVVLR